MGEPYAKRLDMDWDTYRAYHLPSQSDIKAAWNDPQLFHGIREGTIDKLGPSPAQQWGIALEAMLRDGPDDSVTIIPPEVLTKNGAKRGKAWDAYRAENHDKILVSEKEYLTQYYGLERAFSNVMEHQYALSLLVGGDSEWNVKLEWDDEHDFPMKGELDLLNTEKAYVVDVKSSADASVESFTRDVIKFGYDIQAVCYTRAACELLGEASSWDIRYFWCVVENKAPWKVEVFQMSPELREYGMGRVEERITWFKQCQETDRWLSPTHGEIVNLGLPRYLRGKE